MEIKLENINELFNYGEIKRYITINGDYGNSTNNYKIKRVLLNKPSYQLFTENSGVITLAYMYIPDYITFYVINSNTLIKVVSDKREINQSFKNLNIDIKRINNEYDCNEDEETMDTCYDD